MAETIIIDALTREITVPESERAFGVPLSFFTI